MSELRELQNYFQTYLLEADSQIESCIVEPANDSSLERLAIYSHAYRLRLLEVLQKEYDILYKLVGKEIFHQLGYEYIDRYPSSFSSVADFGQFLSHFLATTEPYAKTPHLSELAHFIFELSSTVDAPDASVLSMPSIAEVPQDAWPIMQIKFHPSVKISPYRWNIFEIWRALLDGKEPPMPMQQEKLGYYAVWRKNIDSLYCILTAQEASMMRGLYQEQTFAEVCEDLTQWLAPEAVAEYAVSLLLRWLNDEMLSEVRFKHD